MALRGTDRDSRTPAFEFGYLWPRIQQALHPLIRQVVTPFFVAGPGHLDEVNADADTVQRNIVYAFVKHWSEDAYLFLQHKTQAHWHTPITGGIEEGESIEDAGRREVLEETGFKHLRYKGEVETAP